MALDTAVILAGGKGTRLRPLTYETPKALIPLQGKTLLEHHFDLFKKYGIKNIIISVGYLGDKIKEYFEDGKKFSLNVTYIEENEPLGTAGPLRLANLKKTAIVENGDDLKDIDIGEMYEFHKKNSSTATIALIKVEDPSKYGVARLEGCKIREFVEKPKREEAPSSLINIGLYILEPDVLALIPEGRAMLESDVFPILAQQGRLFGYVSTGIFLDTGSIDTYQRAQKLWKGIR